MADDFPDFDLGPSIAELQVEAWRLKRLIEDGGYPVELAEQLAARRDVDVHQAVELVERGCTPETAAAILL